MGQTDIEMDGAKKAHDSGQNPESAVMDSSGGEIGGNSSCVSVVATSNGTLNGGDVLDNLCKEEKIESENPVKEINFEIQANEQMECPGNDKLDIKDNTQVIDVNSKDKEVAAIRSSLERQIYEATTDAEVNAEIRFVDAVDDSNDIKKAEDKLNEDIFNKNIEKTYEDVQNRTRIFISRKQTWDVADGGLKEDNKLPVELPANEDPQRENDAQKDSLSAKDKETGEVVHSYGNQTAGDDQKGEGAQAFISSCENDINTRPVDSTANNVEDSSVGDQGEASTPTSVVRLSPGKAVFTPTSLPLMGESEDGTPEDQTAFHKEVERFYRERGMDFKQPKFYGQPLNCLKLWKAVIKLGGYDKVTGSKLWRQVGESFHPPKTCTTVSWTFRIFYEKSLLEYERHVMQSGELQLASGAVPEASGVDGEGSAYQGSGSGRAKRDSAARAMQGWHAHRLLPNGEVGEPIMKDKSMNNVAKREKIVKDNGSLKQKRPPGPEVEHPNKAIRTETSKQLVSSVLDVGGEADWVKINVRQTQDCFEVYALVPGLLREEVRVQSDPAGRVVITGQPEQLDNPWGITPFKKVITLPERIDPLQTSAVVSMHGRLLVRVPFEQQKKQEEQSN